MPIANMIMVQGWERRDLNDPSGFDPVTGAFRPGRGEAKSESAAATLKLNAIDWVPPAVTGGFWSRGKSFCRMLKLYKNCLAPLWEMNGGLEGAAEGAAVRTRLYMYENQTKRLSCQSGPSSHNGNGAQTEQGQSCEIDIYYCEEAWQYGNNNRRW